MAKLLVKWTKFLLKLCKFDMRTSIRFWISRWTLKSDLYFAPTSVKTKQCVTHISACTEKFWLPLSHIFNEIEEFALLNFQVCNKCESLTTNESLEQGKRSYNPSSSLSIPATSCLTWNNHITYGITFVGDALWSWVISMRNPEVCQIDVRTMEWHIDGWSKEFF